MRKRKRCWCVCNMFNVQPFCVSNSIYHITIKEEHSNDIDWEIFRECAFAIMDGEKKEGMTYEEYKKRRVCL